MSKLIKKYDLVGTYIREGGYITFPVIGKIIRNDAVGDQIGLDMNGNILWVHEDTNFGEQDISDFIVHNFKNGIVTADFIRNRI